MSTSYLIEKPRNSIGDHRRSATSAAT